MKIIGKKLRSSGAILIAGPKFCGKTTSGSQYAKSIYRINTKRIVKNTRLNPKMALIGNNPHMIDEWQKAPDTRNYVKEDFQTTDLFPMIRLRGKIILLSFYFI